MTNPYSGPTQIGLLVLIAVYNSMPEHSYKIKLASPDPYSNHPQQAELDFQIKAALAPKSQQQIEVDKDLRQMYNLKKTIDDLHPKLREKNWEAVLKSAKSLLELAEKGKRDFLARENSNGHESSSKKTKPKKLIKNPNKTQQQTNSDKVTSPREDKSMMEKLRSGVHKLISADTHHHPPPLLKNQQDTSHEYITAQASGSKSENNEPSNRADPPSPSAAEASKKSPQGKVQQDKKLIKPTSPKSAISHNSPPQVKPQSPRKVSLEELARELDNRKPDTPRKVSLEEVEREQKEARKYAKPFNHTPLPLENPSAPVKAKELVQKTQATLLPRGTQARALAKAMVAEQNAKPAILPQQRSQVAVQAKEPEQKSKPTILPRETHEQALAKAKGLGLSSNHEGAPDASEADDQFRGRFPVPKSTPTIQEQRDREDHIRKYMIEAHESALRHHRNVKLEADE